jgi:hypothetical protein
MTGPTRQKSPSTGTTRALGSLSVRTRIIAFGVICVLAIAGGLVYVLTSQQKEHNAIQTASPQPSTGLTGVENQPRIVFRNTSPGSDYGKMAMVSLADPAGPRAMTDVSCDRVYASSAKILCLSSQNGLVTTYKAQVLDSSPTLPVEKNLPLAGIPSRARLSVDGTLAATTSFTAGDSYAGTSFSTRTVISDLSGSAPNMNLEDYKLINDGKSISPVDRNYWGVTFASDDDTFYATVAWGGSTHLVKGSIKAKTVTTIHTDAECPSLSPDGKTIVYKKRNGQPAGHWRLASLDLATGKETLLAETRNVDDQVDWLNNSTVLYGIPRGSSGTNAAIDDIYEIPSDGTGTPKMLIQSAWSPAVVR